MRQKWLWSYNGLLWTTEGVYVYNDLQNNNIEADEKSLKARLGSKEENHVVYSDDGSIRFVAHDYFALKEQFNLPGRVNFGFSFEFDNKTISSEREIPSGLDVFSKVDRVEVLRENGEVEYADFTIKVW